ncbi:diaminopimelate epimerase [bacterium SCSIO 12741]|nr:diaminopimelate epimerase [bacterium SCSIO 12741]
MIEFYKYEGAGNDFILIDNRDHIFQATPEKVEDMCDRHFGIGADGLILLENAEGYDFRMVYFNSDGHESTMCGNGGRCIVKFAYDLDLIGINTSFVAIDGPHQAEVLGESKISLEMIDVVEVEQVGSDYFLDTGSPHYVRKVPDVGGMDLVRSARSIRYNERFQQEGTNVNFFEPLEDRLMIRTYERGVEDETLACGTGITAVALVAELTGQNTHEGHSHLVARGGTLEVYYDREGNEFNNIRLVGPAKYVFKGEWPSE